MFAWGYFLFVRKDSNILCLADEGQVLVLLFGGNLTFQIKINLKLTTQSM